MAARVSTLELRRDRLARETVRAATDLAKLVAKSRGEHLQHIASLSARVVKLESHVCSVSEEESPLLSHVTVLVAHSEPGAVCDCPPA